MKLCYEDKTFRDSTLAIIEQANEIIDEYMSDGMQLTLRQLYYRFVATDLLPNTQQSYNRLGSIVNDARLAGLIDWEAIVDRTRNLINNPHWSDPANAMDAIVEHYRIDLWADQEYRVEVWIEKEALVGVFEDICSELDVALFPCRGYTSQSEMWRGAQRMMRSKKRTPVVLHFGDHDPSGIDMSRDIDDRLTLFEASDLVFERIALNMDQIEQYDPPPNPAKMTDSRFDKYLAKHGSESWELDALEPRVMRDLVRNHVLRYRDEDIWEQAVELQEEGRARLAEARLQLME